MSELNKFLDQFTSKFDFINAIIVSDREETQVCGSYRNEEEKFKQAALMLSTIVSQANDNLQKLNNTKTKSMTLVYTDHLVFLESWENLKIAIFCVKEANLALIYQIVADLKISLEKLNATIDKTKN